MRTNNHHQVIIDEDDMIDVLYCNDELSYIVVENPDWVMQFNKSCNEFDLPYNLKWEMESELTSDEYVKQNLSNWNLPEFYMTFDIEKHLLDKCSTDEQRDRVIYELTEFNDRDMMLVLRWMTFFVDTLREKQMIWGVGRGSSVASYVLYLLGVHRVDSLKYNLDIKEFLK